MKKLFLILMLFPVIGMAQQTFTVNGSIKQLKDGDKIYLVYQTANKQLSDSALVSDGRFKFNGTIAEVTNGRLFLNRNPFSRSTKQQKKVDELSFYLEPGVISLSAMDSLSKAVVSGTPANKDNEKLKQLLKSTIEKQALLAAKYYNLTEEQQKDEKLVSEIMEESGKIWKDQQLVRLAFVKANPQSQLNLNLLSELINDPQFYSDAKKSFEILGPGMKATASGKALAASIATLAKTSIGSVAMDFEQNDVDGKAVKLSDFKGKYVLLDFWASWCGPCRGENPHVVAAYHKFKDKGFTVLGVSADNNREAWLKAIADDKLEWTHVSDLTGKNPVLEQYGIRGIPSSFLIDPSGKIVASELRGNALEKKLSEIFNNKSK